MAQAVPRCGVRAIVGEQVALLEQRVTVYILKYLQHSLLHFSQQSHSCVHSKAADFVREHCSAMLLS